jgi:ABC-type Fe2+-enterobactin transport system substrate-binding protein
MHGCPGAQIALQAPKVHARQAGSPHALSDDIGFFTYLASIAMARLALVIMGHDIKEVHQ